MPKKPGPKKGSSLKGTNPHPFGQALMKLRKRKGLTQGQLAERMGTSIRMVSYFERQMKNPEVATLEKLAQALGVQPGELLKAEKGGAAEEPVPNRSLQSKLNLVHQLPVEDQKYITKTIEMLADKNKLRKAM
jgi:transcriptional regulator with XRE-family HTH domain